MAHRKLNQTESQELRDVQSTEQLASVLAKYELEVFEVVLRDEDESWREYYISDYPEAYIREELREEYEYSDITLMSVKRLTV